MSSPTELDEAFADTFQLFLVESVYTVKISAQAVGDGLTEFYTPEKILALTTALNDFFSKYRHKIHAGTVKRINQYLDYYDVSPDGSVDEYKVIYFMSQEIVKLLNENYSDTNNYKKLAVIQQFNMVWLLDFFVRQHGICRPKWTRALKKLIIEGDVENHLGKNGVYLVYKILVNFARESKPK